MSNKIFITILWLAILFSLVIAYIENNYKLVFIVLFEYALINIIEGEK